MCFCYDLIEARLTMRLRRYLLFLRVSFDWMSNYILETTVSDNIDVLLFYKSAVGCGL